MMGGLFEQLIMLLLMLSGLAAIIAGLDALYQYAYEVWWRIKRARARRRAQRQASEPVPARARRTARRCSGRRRRARCAPFRPRHARPGAFVVITVGARAGRPGSSAS